MRDRSEEISDIEKRVSDANKYLRIDEARKTVAEIELQVAKPDLWDDPDRARELTTLMARARADVDNLDDLYQKLSDVKTLYELSREEEDDSVTTEVEDGLVALRKDLDHLELRALFAGEHDERDAICEVHSGAGGTDAQDWTEMMMRMFMRWAERQGFTVEVDELQAGAEAGLTSATFTVKGRYAMGM